MPLAVEKPAQLSVSTRVFEHRARCRLVVSLIGAFELDEARRVLLEHTLWRRVTGALPETSCLDEGLPKSRGEVIASASAYAAGGVPATAVPVRLALGAIDKQLWVVGDRHWTRGSPSEPAPFLAMPVDYAHAFGGPGFANNPLGKGIDDAEPAALPNVEHPDRRIASRGDRPEPAGFGAVDITWAERARHAGSHDQRWLDQRYPGYPDDTAPELFQAAPPDQRIAGFFAGDERYVLEGMHPEAPHIEGALPGICARLFVRRSSAGGASGPLEEAATHLDTVHFFPDARTAIVIFRAVCDTTDDDASDVELLLAGFEWIGRKKNRAHYEEVLRRRSDDEWGSIASLCDTDLLPEDCAHEPLIAPSSGEPRPLWAANMRRRAEAELAAMRETLRDRGIDPDAHGVPAELPEPQPIPEHAELPAFLEAIEKEAEQLRREAEDKRAEAEERSRDACDAAGLDYDALREEAARDAAGPPSFRADDVRQRLVDQLQLATNAGVELPLVAAQLADRGLRERLEKTERDLHDNYRRLAHHMHPAARLTGIARDQLRTDVERALQRGESLTGRDLTGADLSGLDLAGQDLSGSYLETSDLSGCDLSGANLSRAVLARADLSGAKLRGAQLAGANLGSAQLDAADLSEADLREVVLEGAQLSGARLCEADLRDVSLRGAHFADTDFSRARCPNATLIEADLSGIAAPGADLSHSTFVDVDLSGVDLRGAQLEEVTLVKARADRVCLAAAQLRNAVITIGCALSDADLANADLTGANLSGTKLRRADLTGARLDGANLDGVDLRDACLRQAVARDARLGRTSLRDADARGINLMRATLRKTDLRGARCEGANLFRADLARVVGDDRTSFRGALVDEVRVVKPGGGLTRIDS